MNYFIWELNQERKEIIYNRSEGQMGEMVALSESEFSALVKKHPDYQLIDLEMFMMPVFKNLSSKHSDGDMGIVEMLMKGFPK